MHAGVAGKLRAAALYNEACNHYYNTRGIAVDQVAGRALFE